MGGGYIRAFKNEKEKTIKTFFYNPGILGYQLTFLDIEDFSYHIGFSV